MGVDESNEHEQGAGDQGLMFGYATDETEEGMPLTVILAHKLNSRIAEMRRNGELAWARPDSKTQVNEFTLLQCLLQVLLSGNYKNCNYNQK